MKIGFLFPGQGSQSVGMGKDLYDKYEVVRNVYDKVKELTNIDVEKISFERNRRRIKSNEIYSNMYFNNEFGNFGNIKWKWNKSWSF